MTTFHPNQVLNVWVSLTLSVALTLSSIAACWGQVPDLPAFTPTEIPVDSSSDRTPLAARKRVVPSDVNAARMILGELEGQMRIATTKLDPELLTLKKNVGRMRSLLAETQQRINLLSAERRRLQERARQVRQDIFGSEKDAAAYSSDDAAQQLLAQYTEPIAKLDRRLETLAEYKSQLQQKLEADETSYLRRLLAAVIAPEREDQTVENDTLLKLLKGEFDDAPTSGEAAKP